AAVAGGRRVLGVVAPDLPWHALLLDEDGEPHIPHRRALLPGGHQPGVHVLRTPSRMASSAAARSAGYSLVTATSRPCRGWAKPSRTACSHWRVSPSRSASTGSAP